VITEKQLT